MQSKPLQYFIYLSIAAAVVTIGLKFMAYIETGSVGFLSDALESFVNLFAAIVALILLRISEKPADETHGFGHSKAEYFSSAIEGALILVAAISIIYSAVPRLINPQPLENISIGMIYSAAATIINLIVGRILIKKGKEAQSIILEADGRHLMTDVITSVGVIFSIFIVQHTGWYILDPIIAIAVALNIVYTGYKLISRSTRGLMDVAISQEELQQVTDYLHLIREKGFDYHSLLTRQAGKRKFISFHLLVPGKLTVKEGHDYAEEIEQHIESMFNENATVTSHLEPIEDPASFNDIGINRQNYMMSANPED